jgi:8-oxo-dGTP diphosphatase
MKSDYVVGFVFNVDKSEVALILKNRPAWQAGRLNGIGGHIEEEELPLDAMHREFREETGYGGRLPWRCFAVMGRDDRNPRFRCHCFVAVADEPHLRNLGLYTAEDQPIVVCFTNAIPDHALSNIKWLVPMAADEDVADGCPYTTIATVGISRERMESEA